MKRICMVFVIFMVIFWGTVNAENADKEYVAIVNKVVELKDGKKVKEYKYLDVIKVTRIEMKNKRYIGYTDSGEIDMGNTNYIEDESKYFINKQDVGIYYRVTAAIPKMKYYLFDHKESKYYSENLDVYYGRGVGKNNLSVLENVKSFIILNGQKIYYTREVNEPAKGDYFGIDRKEMTVGVELHNGETWAYITVTYTPAYRMIALKTAFSLAVEQLKEYNEEEE